MDLPCLLSPVYSTAVGLEFGDVTPEEHKGGVPTAPGGSVPWVTASLQTHGWFARLLQSQVPTGFHHLSQLVRLLDIASTMLCMLVHIYLRAPVLSLTFLHVMKEEFPPDTVTTQNTISIALIIFFIPVKRSHICSNISKNAAFKWLYSLIIFVLDKAWLLIILALVLPSSPLLKHNPCHKL